MRALDEIASDATPSPIAADVAGWWCKAAPDLPFRRCNVARPPLGAGRDRVRARSEWREVRAWYAALGQRAIVQVSSADPEAEALDRVLAGEGLLVEAPVHVMIAACSSADRGPQAGTIERPGGRAEGIGRGGEPIAATVRSGVDEAWALAYGVIHGGGAAMEERTAAYGRMLGTFGDRALAVVVRSADRATLGLGYGVLDRGWLGIFGMGTAPEHRRRGIASAVVRALVDGAVERGVTKAYLQVETDNAPAIACYERLGFAISHGYHYRADRPDPDQGC